MLFKSLLENKSNLMIKNLVLSFSLLFISCVAFTQSEDSAITRNDFLDIGIEFQAYPTGLIPGLRIEKGFAGKHAVHFRFGYQWIRHRDLGVHDDERGNGYGFTLGYRKYFQDNFKGWSISSRCDLWANDLDWTDESPLGDITITGNTKVKVIQPTLDLGYTFIFGKHTVLTPTVAFGYEVNVQTKGKDVGEGAIFLLGVELSQRF